MSVISHNIGSAHNICNKNYLVSPNRSAPYKRKRKSPLTASFENSSLKHINKNLLAYIIDMLFSEEPIPSILKSVKQLALDLRAEHSLNFNQNTKNYSELSCPCCFGVLFEPITLVCGHTCCKQCILRESDTISCKMCPYRGLKQDILLIRTNVLIASLAEKWWKNESESIRYLNKGRENFSGNRLEEALSDYNTAAQFSMNNYPLLNDRSHLFMILNRPAEALNDADAMIRLQPDCPLGHFRRATALSALEKYEDVVVELLICATLEEESRVDYLIRQIGRVLSSVNVFGEADNSYDPERTRTGKRGRKGNYNKRTSSTSPSTPILETSQNFDRYEVGNHILETYHVEMDKLMGSESESHLEIGSGEISATDFECTLCFLTLWRPVSTPCGHTFCRSCLDRSLDHGTNCPLCKFSLLGFIGKSERKSTEFIEYAISTYLPDVFSARQKQYEGELEEYSKAGTDSQHEIPIFIATVGIPTVACPLHVFEPRYRLMIRRSIESGTREFGMCHPCDGENGFGEYGTMLVIKDINYLPNGSSVLHSVGSKRFKIISKSMRDGYNTACVEYQEDNPIDLSDLSSLETLQENTYREAEKWFHSIDPETKGEILRHYGGIPPTEPQFWLTDEGTRWLWWLIAILPIDPKIQVKIIHQTSLRKRIEIVSHVLQLVLKSRSKAQTNGATSPC